MNAVLWWLAHNTLAVALMIPAVLLLCRLFQSRPAVQHVLWLVLLVKLVLPPILEFPWLADGIATWPLASATVAEPAPLPAIQIAGAQPQWIELPDEVKQTDTESVLSFANATPAIFALWCAGCGVACLMCLRRVARHRTLIRSGAVAPRHLDEQIRDVAEQMGLRPIRAVVVSRIASPFVWCLGRLRLIWPAALVTEDDVKRSRGIIAHELAHIRRRDHWVTWLEFAAGLLYWWNPVFWLVRRRLRESTEWACDAVALGAMPDERRAYAEIFLELSSNVPSAAPAPVLGMSAGASSSFERRLSMILSERVSCTKSWRGIVAAGLLAVLAIPSWTIGQSSTAPPPLTDFEKRLLRELLQREQAIKAAQAKEDAQRAEWERDAAKAAQLIDKASADLVRPAADAERHRAEAQVAEAEARLKKAAAERSNKQSQYEAEYRKALEKASHVKETGERQAADKALYEQQLSQAKELQVALELAARDKVLAIKLYADMADLREKMNDLAAQLQKLSQTHGDKHPVMLEKRQQLAQVQTRLESLAQAQAEQAQAARAHVAQAQVAQARAADAQAEAAAKKAAISLIEAKKAVAAANATPKAATSFLETTKAVSSIGAGPAVEGDQATILKLKQMVEALERDKVALLDQLKMLQARATNAAAVAPKKTELSVFRLTNVKAKEMAKVLIDLFAKDGGPSITIVAEPSTNSLLVRGAREQIDIVEALVARLDDFAAHDSDATGRIPKGGTSVPGKGSPQK